MLAAAHLDAGQRAGDQVDAVLADAVGVAVGAGGRLLAPTCAVKLNHQRLAGVDRRRHGEDRLRGRTADGGRHVGPVDRRGACTGTAPV